MSARRQAIADRAGSAAGGDQAQGDKPEGGQAQGTPDKGGSVPGAPGGEAAAHGAPATNPAAPGDPAAIASQASAPAEPSRSAGRGPAAAPRAGSARNNLPTRVPASGRRPGRGRGGSGLPARAGQAAHDRDAGAAADLPGQPASSGLSARLLALARMIQIGSARSGRDGFSKKLLAESEDVLSRAGERMRLSSNHTVVVLAGGTGSGKSSLFNRVAGAEFSTVGVTRPVTTDVHACIWGATGSGALLDWLGVPGRYRYARASALDRGEQDLSGLVLLDLPDHDSVLGHAGDVVDKFVSLADVMVWVLDPQKYADAAVHRRFLVPMAGHSEVLAVVLNQSDLLDPAVIDDCVADLRRLLDSENLPDVPILVTSALTGSGLDELRTLLVDAVAARRAATQRISADVDRMVTRFVPYGGNLGDHFEPVPADSGDKLAGRFAAAAGVGAVSDSLTSASELRAADFVGWPVAWAAQRVAGRDPMRKVRLGKLWNELSSITAGPAGAQQAEIDNALTDFGDSLGDPLPEPWSHTVRSAVRSRSEDIPAAVGAAIGEALPAEGGVAWWWRVVGALQGLLMGAVVVAVIWMLLIVVFGVFGVGTGIPDAFTDKWALPWLAGAVVVALGLGAGMAWASLEQVRKTAERENAAVTADIRQRIAAVADETVVIPVTQELSEFGRYRDELLIAQDGKDASAAVGAEDAMLAEAGDSSEAGAGQPGDASEPSDVTAEAGPSGDGKSAPDPAVAKAAQKRAPGRVAKAAGPAQAQGSRESSAKAAPAAQRESRKDAKAPEPAGSAGASEQRATAGDRKDAQAESAGES